MTDNKQLLQAARLYDSDFELWYRASQIYYDINESEDILTNEEFDELTEKLIEKYNTPQSEEQNFIIGVVRGGIQLHTGDFLIPENKSQINTSQISLKKIKYNGSKTIMETKKFLSTGIYNQNEHKLFLSPKLDGISLKIKTQPELLIQTRGGQNVTNELKSNLDIIALLSKLNDTKHTIVHGELVIDKKVFKEKYSDEYENPRNCIVGVLKTNPNDLRFIVCTDGLQPANINFNIWKELTPGINLEQYFIQNFKNDVFPFQVDGMVIGHKLKSESEFQVKNNYPLNMVAIKFKAESVQTQITDIEWTIKKSGKLTPILHVKPIFLDGSTVTKASGYSYHTLKSKRIGIGSQITIHKSGDIIPTVDRVLSRSTEWNLPTDIDWQEDGKHIKTIQNTETQQSQKFILGLKLLQLDGIGPVISEKIGQIVEYDIIRLFDTNFKPDIKILLGSDSANWSRFEQFYNIKTIPLDQLIEMLQIDNCGKTLSRKFAEIMTGKQVDTKGMNKQLLKDVCSSSGKYNTLVKESMNKLKQYGIKVIKPIEVSEDSFSFEMSGEFKKMSKNDFVIELKKSKPNWVHSTLNKNTNYLIVDDLNTNTSKANKARKYNIKIITYDEALKM